MSEMMKNGAGSDAGSAEFKKIAVLRGVRYTPDHYLKRMEKSLARRGIEVRCVNTIYSLCWIFQFRIRFPMKHGKDGYGGYYAGYDESVMTPGKLAFLPEAEETEVRSEQILADRLTEQEALELSWKYNKRGIFRKFRSLSAPPELADHVTERMYKPMYVFEYHNTELDEKKYRVMDSLTGDLEEITITR